MRETPLVDLSWIFGGRKKENKSEEQRIELLKRLQEGAKHAPLKVSLNINNKVVELMVGVPRNTDQLLPDETYYGIPNTPHIFIAKELHVIDHEGERIFHNQVILLSHGGRVKGDYLFGDRQRLKDILEAYSILVKKLNLPNINFLCACNSEVTNRSNLSLSEEMFSLLRSQDISFGYSNIYLYKYIPIDGSGLPDLFVSSKKEPRFWFSPKSLKDEVPT